MEALRARARDLLAGFWVVPLVTTVAMAGLAFALVAADSAAGPKGISFGFDGDAAAARTILSVVAGSLITVIGLTFSLTIVTLQLVSGQLTPRAMRGMLADRTTQLVAGVFVGVVVYALVVLRSVGGSSEPDALLPSFATTVAIWLTIAALGLLIFFVHHIGVTIQLSTITARLGRQTVAAVERSYPDEAVLEHGDDGAAELVRAWRRHAEPRVVHVGRAGYVRAVALDDIARALPPEARAAVAVCPGDFVTATTPAIELWGVDDAAEDVTSTVTGAIVVADERDLREDVAFGLRQLADIALRAISPGINDPTSAVTAIGYIQAILEQLARRAYPERVQRLDDRTIVRRIVTFAEHVETSFVELGRYAVGDPRVACALLDALDRVGSVAAEANDETRVEAVVATASRVAAPAVESARTTEDADAIRTRLARVMNLQKPAELD